VLLKTVGASLKSGLISCLVIIQKSFSASSANSFVLFLASVVFFEVIINSNKRGILITREQKEKLFTEYSEIFSTLSAGILLDYKGVSVGKITEFRKKLAKEQSSMRVLKNRVAKKAIADSKLAEAQELLSEPRALAYSKNDMVTLAKVICEELEELENCKIISGFLLEDGKATILSEKEVVAMSKLESKEELLSKLLYLMNAPVTQFVRTINEVPASFVRLLAKISENK
jgi:large subunit ribosomal protein L10